MLFGKKIIALCTARINDSLMGKFISVLNNKLNQNGFKLLIFSMNSELYWNEENISTEASVYEIINYDITDAIVIMDERIKSRTITESIIARARAYGVPALTVDGKYEGVPCVSFDYEKGFEKIVRHVIEDHAIRKPHFMAGIKGNSFSEKRIEIFKKVIAENGIPFDDSMLSYGDFWSKPASEAAQRIVDSGNIPEAVICANDHMAINVSNVFKLNGINVPEQVIVTGFDGVDEIYVTNPKIASAGCDSGKIADAVFDALSDIVGGKTDIDDSFIVPDLIPNSSCGCPEYDDPITQVNVINDGFYHYQDDLKLLFEISGRMQTCDTPGQMAAHLHNDLMKDMYCMINKSCFVREKNYFADGDRPSFDNEMELIYDYRADNYEFIHIDRSASKINPEFDHLFKTGCPLVYNSIVFMRHTLGYVCFYSEKSGIIERFRMFQINMSLGIGIGGFLIRQHQKYLSEKVEEMYKYDSLTQLYNRNGFNSVFEAIRSQKSRYGEAITVISADLDGLKYINDNFGHDAGDNAIRLVSYALKSSCPKEAICVRYGGDEMLAVIFGEVSPTDVLAKIDSMLSDINKASGNEYVISASFGCYQSQLASDFNFDRAVKQADMLMYSNKKAKKQMQ